MSKIGDFMIAAEELKSSGYNVKEVADILNTSVSFVMSGWDMLGNDVEPLDPAEIETAYAEYAESPVPNKRAS